MSTWYADAVAIIETIHQTLPADANLKARRKALREGKPDHFWFTSWRQKTWSRARAEYMARFQPPRTTLPESPLERRRRRSEQRQARP